MSTFEQIKQNVYTVMGAIFSEPAKLMFMTFPFMFTGRGLGRILLDFAAKLQKGMALPSRHMAGNTALSQGTKFRWRLVHVHYSPELPLFFWQKRQVFCS